MTKKFKCQKCGWCCKNVNINISYHDILRWAKEKRFDILNQISYIDSDDKKKKGFYIVDTVTAPKKDCPFLKDNLCLIYKTRPRACKDFPFAHEKNKLPKECKGCNSFIPDKVKVFELKKDQLLDFTIAEDRKERLIKILESVRAVAKLLNDIEEFGDDPTENLWVDGFDATKDEWGKVGTSPYLNAQDAPTHYIFSMDRKAEIGDFSFADTTRPYTDTLNSVTLYVYGQTNIAGNIFYIWDGTAWTNSGLPEHSGTWSWVSVNISTLLNTWAKVDGAKLYIWHPNSTSTTSMDASYLLVDYTAGGNFVDFVGAVNANAIIDGNFKRKRNFIGEVIASSQTNGILKTNKKLSGVISALSQTDAIWKINKKFSGAVNALSEISGNLVLKVYKDLIGSVNALSQIDSIITRTRNFSGATDALSQVDGNLTRILALQGFVDTISQTDANIKVNKKFQGAVSALSQIDGILKRYRRLIGNVNAQSQTDALLKIYKDFIGAVDALSEIDGFLYTDKKFIGAVLALSETSGLIKINKKFAGSVEALSDVLGSLTIEEGEEEEIIRKFILFYGSDRR